MRKAFGGKARKGRAGGAEKVCVVSPAADSPLALLIKVQKTSPVFKVCALSVRWSGYKRIKASSSAEPELLVLRLRLHGMLVQA